MNEGGGGGGGGGGIAKPTVFTNRKLYDVIAHPDCC